MLELVLRLGISLAVVLGLFWLVARAGARRLGGSRGLMRVHGRQSLSRTASVAVVEVGSRVLLVGVSDGGVRLLTELDPDEIVVDEPAPEQAAPVGGGLTGAGPTARLAGLVAARLHRLRAARRPVPTVPAAGEIAGIEVAGLEVAGLAGVESAAVPTDATGASVAAVTRAAAPAAVSTVRATRVARSGGAEEAGTGALSGSLLAPQTWRQAWAAATSRTPVPATLDATVPAGAGPDETRIGDPVHG